MAFTMDRLQERAKVREVELNREIDVESQLVAKLHFHLVLRDELLLYPMYVYIHTLKSSTDRVK